MIGTRMVLLRAAIVAMTLRSFPVVGVRTQVHYKWQSNCDYVGGDLKAVGGISSTCGHLCVIEEKCTHWSWTDVNGGTCWLKQSKAASISKSAGQGFCGYITDRVTTSDSMQNHAQNNPAQIDSSPIQYPTILDQNPVPKTDLPMSWTFSNEKTIETPAPAQIELNLAPIELNPLQYPTIIDQNPVQKADLPLSWTFSNEKVTETPEVKPAQIPVQVEQNPVQDIPPPIEQNPVQDIPPPIEQNPVQDIPPPIEQNPVQDIPPPVEQKPVQKADPPTASPAPPCDNGLTTADNAKMLSSLNSYRADNGLAALAIDNRLAAAALVHSQYQAKYCVMQHEGTDGSTPGDRMKSQNYVWSYCAENVAAGQANVSEVMKSWWNSEHHRENILRVTVTHVGFALVSNEACEYKRFWTQDFGAEQTA
ncbi:unnamed protein product [Peronospora effusa]|nr:unnamed protein product [Peronospora effusa]